MRRKGLVIATFVAAAVYLIITAAMEPRPPRGVKPFEKKMLTTGYCLCGKCCGWERTWYGMPVHSGGNQKGKRKRVGMTPEGVAVSHGSLAADTNVYPLNTVMYIDGYGYGKVVNTGTAIKGEHIDLYFGSHDEAMEWGEKSMQVKVWLPPRRKN